MSAVILSPETKSQDLAWSRLPALSDLGAYARFVNSLPMLEEGEERALARRLRDRGDLEAAKALVMSHLRVVVKAARDYQGYGLPPEDLIQEGNIGLMKAVKRFDPERGVRLVSYAILWIRAQMQEYILDNWRLVKIGSSKAMKKLFFGLRSLREQLGEAPEGERIRRIAKELNVSEADVQKASVWFAGGEERLDAPLEGSDSEVSRDLEATSASPEEAASLSQRERMLPSAALEALSGLNDRERAIIEDRFLAEEPKTLSDLSARFGVSIERVRQLEAGALKKMRAKLEGKKELLLPLLNQA